MIFLIGKSVAFIGVVSMVICLAELIPLTGSVYFTEIALKKAFDERGKIRR